MKTKYLLPNYFIKIGLVLFIVALLSDNYAERFITLSDPKVDAAFAAKGKQYKTYFYKNDPDTKIKVRSADEFKYWYTIHQQQPKTNRRFNGARTQSTSFCNSKMQRLLNLRSNLTVCLNSEENIRSFQTELEVVKIHFVKNFNMPEC